VKDSQPLPRACRQYGPGQQQHSVLRTAACVPRSQRKSGRRQRRVAGRPPKRGANTQPAPRTCTCVTAYIYRQSKGPNGARYLPILLQTCRAQGRPVRACRAHGGGDRRPWWGSIVAKYDGAWSCGSGCLPGALGGGRTRLGRGLFVGRAAKQLPQGSAHDAPQVFLCNAEQGRDFFHIHAVKAQLQCAVTAVCCGSLPDGLDVLV